MNISNIKEKIDSNKTSENSGSNSQFPDEIKDQTKYNLSKFEYDLYHEEYDVAEKIIRVKRYCLPNEEEKWKISEDNKVLWTIEGSKLNKKEKQFLRTIDGVNFLIALHKSGINSFNHIRSEIKKKLKP